MKKLVLGLFMSGLFTVVKAQPVFQSALIKSGTYFTVYEFTNPTAALKQGGANVTWDLTSANKTPVGVVAILPVDSYPNASAYPDANLTWRMTTSSGTTYNLLKLSSGKLEQVAAYLGSGDSTVYLILRDLVKFPLNYLDTFYDSYQKQGQAAMQSFFAYDAWGQFTTSSGTLDSIARVIEVRSSGTTDTSAIWWHFHDGMMYPALEATEDGDIYIIEPITVPVGLQGLPETSENYVYPNPSQGEVHVSLAPGVHQATFSAFDLSGRLVYTELVQHGRTIQLQELQSGLYIYQLVSDHQLLHSGKYIKH